MKYTDKLNEYIKFRREESGLSLNKFCIEAEIETSTLSRCETGKRKISLETLMKIASFYKQTPAEFLTDFERYNETNS